MNECLVCTQQVSGQQVGDAGTWPSDHAQPTCCIYFNVSTLPNIVQMVLCAHGGLLVFVAQLCIHLHASIDTGTPGSATGYLPPCEFSMQQIITAGYCRCI
ncbi:hypothetical protein ABBQ38_012296 [Trebouxia sp. C0009 RCD-2024]